MEVLQTDSEMKKSLETVIEKMFLAYNRCTPKYKSNPPRLVAVSKTKSKEAVIEAYGYGQRHFGENYVQELFDKANDEELQKKCPDIKWHFIGHLQSNKVSKMIAVPNLSIIETVDSLKLATVLNKAWLNAAKEPLLVMLQVNTSLEESKSGMSSEEVGKVAEFVLKGCEGLKLAGLMTIGSFDHDLSKGINPDFQMLIQCRDSVAEKLGLACHDLELSMGMSNDFEHAIEMGSTNIRVGSTIFGARS